MARKASKEQPSLLDEPAMKDVTPKKTAAKVLPKNAELAPASKPSMAKRQSTAVAVAAPKMEEGKTILALISDVAGKPDFNPENMRQLLDMQKEIMAEQARRDFGAAFVALQAELPVINATGRIEVRKKDASGERTGAIQQSTPYATFNNIMDAIQPLLTKYGFGLSFETAPSADGNRILVTGTLEHGGHQRQTVFPLPAETSGSKNNVQGWGSSLSFGKRYCTIALLNIRSAAPEERDTDGYHVPNLQRGKGDKLVQVAEAERINKDQLRSLIDVIDDCGLSKETFCETYEIPSVADLPANLYGAALKKLDAYKAKKGQRRG